MQRKLYFMLVLILNNVGLFGQSYCIPHFNNSDIYINNFAFHTLVNQFSSTKSSNYIFYPDSVFNARVTIGEKYPITISGINTYGGGRFAAWIDFNNDKIFDSSELIYSDTLGSHSSSGFVTIPNNTSFIGKRRMRVIHAYRLFPNACGSYSSGECEDYEINIVANQPHIQTYCMPFSPPGLSSFIIGDFILGSINNVKSGSYENGYTFYPENEFTTDLVLDQPYSVFIAKGEYAGITGGFALWIDLNNNGEFEYFENLYYTRNPNLYYVSGFITIPNDKAFLGKRRLRVRSSWGENPSSPCEMYRDGESEDYIVNIIDKLTSIENEKANQLRIQVYPNPSLGKVFIKNETTIDEVQIMDALGKIVFDSKPNQKECSFDLNAAGIYYIKVISLDKSITSKLIIQ